MVHLLYAPPFASINCRNLSVSVELKKTIRRKPTVNAAVEEVAGHPRRHTLLRAGVKPCLPTGLLARDRASMQNMTKFLKDTFFGKEGEAGSGHTERWRLCERVQGLQVSSHHVYRQSWGLMLRFTAIE